MAIYAASTAHRSLGKASADFAVVVKDGVDTETPPELAMSSTPPSAQG